MLHSYGFVFSLMVYYLSMAYVENDILILILQQECSENGDTLLHDTKTHVGDTHEFVCTRCNLNIQERFVIGPFGDSNVCGQYIESVMKQSNILNCPTCGKRIENVIRVHQM